MQPFPWFILAWVVVAFIIYAYIASKVGNAWRKRRRRERLPDAPAPLIAGRIYNIQLSHGLKIHSATVMGLSEEMEEQPWELRHWVVVKGKDGRLRYLRPFSIRYVEDAGPPAAAADR